MRLFLLLLAALLTACTTQTHSPTTQEIHWEQHVQQLTQMDQWLLEGKLGYRDSRDGGSAWVNWQQQQRDFAVKLNGPFGAGATYITGNHQYAELKQAGRETITAQSPAALTEQLFGWQWPVGQLQFWVRGIPAPGDLPEIQYHNPDGTLAHLSQSSWQLQFLDYQQVDEWRLPGKIKGKRGDYSFTLIIKNWQPGAPH